MREYHVNKSYNINTPTVFICTFVAMVMVGLKYNGVQLLAALRDNHYSKLLVMSASKISKNY